MPETAGTTSTGGRVQIEVINPDFGTTKGVVLRQFVNKAEAIMAMMDIPYEQKNKYKISVLPPDKNVKKTPDDTNGWEPTNMELSNLPLMFDMREESDCCTRTLMYACGMLNLRPMQLHVYEANGATQQEVFQIDRPFACGGCLGAIMPDCLLRWDVKDRNGKQFGMVRENYECPGKCIAQMCQCTTYADIYEGDENEMQRVYQTRTNTFCVCGNHNNCCGGTCFKNDFIIDILDDNDQIVATMQKTYAAGDGNDGCLDSGFCRQSLCGMYSQYLIEFPPGSTPNQRALILTSVLHTDFMYFEKKGDENDN